MQGSQTQIEQIRQQVVEKILPGIVFDGWSWSAVESAFKELGYARQMAYTAFPCGIVDVLDCFSRLADQRMMEQLAHINATELNVRERIHKAVLIRFEWLKPHKEAFRDSASLLAWPTRKLRAGKMVWRTADTIWNWAGDTAEDYNRYTKRTLLSAILVSVSLMWLAQKSEDEQNISDFLLRRINELSVLGRFVARFKKAEI